MSKRQAEAHAMRLEAAQQIAEDMPSLVLGAHNLVVAAEWLCNGLCNPVSQGLTEDQGVEWIIKTYQNRTLAGHWLRLRQAIGVATEDYNVGSSKRDPRA